MGIFITILDDGKKLRLRALPKQEDRTGEKYDTTKNIQGDKSIGEMYSPGTILYTDSLVDTGRGFYRAGSVRHATRKEAKSYENMKYELKGFKDQELNIWDVI